MRSNGRHVPILAGCAAAALLLAQGCGPGKPPAPIPGITPAPVELPFPGPDLALDPGTPAPIFRDDSVLPIELRAPFSDLIDTRTKDAWTRGLMGAFVDGEYVWTRVRVRLRGRIRLDLCDFPNLRLEPDEGQETAGTPFEDAAIIKLTTHCDKPPEYVEGVERRVIGTEDIVYRERLAYVFWTLLSERGLATRRAEINYVDTGTGLRMTRRAFLLEDKRSLAERYGGKLAPEESRIWRPSQRAKLTDDKDIALLHLFQIMLGNEDWTLWDLNESVPWRLEEPDDGGSWEVPDIAEDFLPDNMLFIRRKDAVDLPDPYDYDLSNAITGYIEHRIGTRLPEELMPGESPQYRDIYYSLQAKFRPRHTRPGIDWALARLRAQRPVLEQAMERGDLDREGRRIMRQRLEDFFRASSDEVFHVETVVADDAVLFEDSALTETACRRLPDGIPLLVRERAETAVRVQLLDYWSDPSCFGRANRSERKEGWVPAGVLSADFPAAE